MIKASYIIVTVISHFKEPPKTHKKQVIKRGTLINMFTIVFNYHFKFPRVFIILQVSYPFDLVSVKSFI